MSDDANRLIDNLFERINEAEKQTGERDKDAEAHINKHLVNNPSAPYYMAQTIIMQEAALKQLKARVDSLEKQVDSKPSSGGFLSGLFGGGNHSSQDTPSFGNSAKRQSGWGGATQQGNPQQAYQQQGYAQQANQGGRFGGGGSFLGGALQTAAGVAGGLVVGNMLMDMFGHHTQTEIVDVINESPATDTSQPDVADNSTADATDSSGFDQNGVEQAGWDQGDAGQGGFGQAGFDQGGMDPNGFNSDIAGGGFDQTDFNQGGFDGGGFDDFGSDDDFI